MIRLFKPLVFAGCAAPLLLLGYDFFLAFTGRDPMALGADPNKELLHQTGQAAISILLLTLSVTPIRRLSGINRVQSVRRMLGVWSFTYVTVHLSIYLVFDQLCYSFATCDARAIWDDILQRRFIFAGEAGFLMLLLLAITSTNGWMRRLKRNWGRLHRLAYAAAVAAIIHFIWIQKSGISRPLPWLVWLVAVLGLRVYWSASKRFRQVRTTVSP